MVLHAWHVRNLRILFQVVAGIVKSEMPHDASQSTPPPQYSAPYLQIPLIQSTPPPNIQPPTFKSLSSNPLLPPIFSPLPSNPSQPIHSSPPNIQSPTFKSLSSWVSRGSFAQHLMIQLQLVHFDCMYAHVLPSYIGLAFKCIDTDGESI